MYKKILYSTALSTLLLSGTIFTANALNGGDYYYFVRQEEVGLLTNDWEFYYNNDDGDKVSLNEFKTGRSMEPIIYKDNLYVRSGFIMDYLGFDGDIDFDNKVITFNHPKKNNGSNKEFENKPNKNEVNKPVEDLVNNDNNTIEENNSNSPSLEDLVDKMHYVHWGMSELYSDYFHLIAYDSTENAKNNIKNKVKKFEREVNLIRENDIEGHAVKFLEDYDDMIYLFEKGMRSPSMSNHQPYLDIMKRMPKSIDYFRNKYKIKYAPPGYFTDNNHVGGN